MHILMHHYATVCPTLIKLSLHALDHITVMLPPSGLVEVEMQWVLHWIRKLATAGSNAQSIVATNTNRKQGWLLPLQSELLLSFLVCIY